jgi:voltage-gated potassium channel
MPAVMRPARRHVLRHAIQIGGVSIGALLLYFLLPLDHFGPLFSGVLLLGLLGAMVPMTLRHARKVASSSTPMIEAASALLTLISALVIGFATIHYSMAHQIAGQFNGLDTKVDGLYFTTTVLSTVGFGDITPTGQIARVVVSIQMLFDLAFVGVAVRLLGQALRTARGVPLADP